MIKDKSVSIKLTIELVPESCFYSNVRSHLPKSKWDIIRKQAYREAGYKCEVCGGVGPRHPVECHEVWSYDDQTRTQKLERLIALCPACHMVKHIGFANIQGKGEEAADHLAKINGWTREQAGDYIAESFRLWDERNSIEWESDLSHLDSLEESDVTTFFEWQR